MWVERSDGPDQEATIPAGWVDSNSMTVRWPVRVNALRAMQENRVPEAHWKTFKLIKIKLQNGMLVNNNSLTETKFHMYIWLVVGHQLSLLNLIENADHQFIFPLKYKIMRISTTDL